MNPPESSTLLTLSQVLSSEECQRLIERGEKIGFERAVVSTNSGPQLIPKIRDNDRASFDDPELAISLWKRVTASIPTPLRGSRVIGLDDHFRFYRYDVGQRFKSHRDGVVEKSASIRSQLTCLFYLNSDFQGGETVFYGEHKVDGLRPVVRTITPGTGDALFFDHHWWHEGRSLTEGRKYVLRTDILYEVI
jgi:predicted 2-oxoglutarate/Fe(II)-dependent dioxygenase YbiX